MNTLNTLALEYVIAIYPLFLMVVIHFSVEMYDRGVSPLGKTEHAW